MLAMLERRPGGQGLLRVPIAKRCAACGAEFAATRADRIYCSGACRTAARQRQYVAWNEKRRLAYFARALLMRPSPVYCRSCGVAFTPLMWDPTYCTEACARRKHDRDKDRRQRALARLAKAEGAKT